MPFLHAYREYTWNDSNELTLGCGSDRLYLSRLQPLSGILLTERSVGGLLAFEANRGMERTYCLFVEVVLQDSFDGFWLIPGVLLAEKGLYTVLWIGRKAGTIVS